MLNSQKFKTAEERAREFDKFCSSSHCLTCELYKKNRDYPVDVCLAYWLDMDAEKEAPLPCPFCGSNTVVKSYVTVRHVDNHIVECTNCQYRSEEKLDRDRAIAAHNSVAWAVMAAGKEVK